MRVLALLAALGVLTALVIALLRDPEDTLWLAAFSGAIAVALGALAVILLSSLPGGTRRGGALRPRTVRRGAEAGVVVALLLLLRVVDGLSPITAAFVVVSFVAAEAVLVARPGSSSR